MPELLDEKTAAGRFAPSPSGPLHLGSLYIAIASYLDARKRAAPWLLRIEDLDPPREMAGAADDIQRVLDALQLDWDGEVLFQSSRMAAYRDAVWELARGGYCFDCGCTRQEIRQAGVEGGEGPIYPGTCRAGLAGGKRARSVRVRVPAQAVAFRDQLQGEVSQSLAREVGDFVIRRADGLYAYQLAVVVDDAHQAVGQVVRGMDLFGSTPRQIHLQACLGYPHPKYMHLPVLLDSSGRKLSKSLHAEAVSPQRGSMLWLACLDLLGQHPPLGLQRYSVEVIRDWAIQNWSRSALPRGESIAWAGVSALLRRWGEPSDE